MLLILGIDNVLTMKSVPQSRDDTGPAGVSKVRELCRPMITDKIPTRIANRAICSGELEKHLADAAGIINKAVMSNTPTIFIEIAITEAMSIIKISSARSGRRPSALAISDLLWRE